MTESCTLTDRLTARGLPGVRAQLAHPTVAGIARGDLDPAVFRSWLEQDYLFLLDYVRVFSRLAWQAPADHLGDLVDLAHSIDRKAWQGYVDARDYEGLELFIVKNLMGKG